MAVWSVIPAAELSPDIRWDAEHYRPEYVLQSEQVAKRATKPLIEVANVSDGNHLSIAEEFGDEGVRYLRGQDLKDFFISDADPVYIPNSVYGSLSRSHMFPGDVLVGIVGTIGTVGLVTNRHGQLTGNCKLAIVRSHSLPGEYIAAYLSSRLGQFEIARRIRGAVQMGLILPDLKAIPIIEPTEGELSTIVGAVKSAQEFRRRSVEITLSAEARLMATLGLDRLDLSQQKFTTSDIRQMHAADRLDAEYLCNPGLAKWKAPFECLPIGHPTVSRRLSNGSTPAATEYADHGYPIIKVGDVEDDATASWGGERVSSDAPAARGERGELQKNDIVMLCAAHHVSYIGKSGLFTGIDGYDGPVRSVGELITVRSSSAINAESLCLYLNLPAVRCESQRYVRGMSAHLYPSDLRHLPVPLLPRKLQDELADSFNDAVAARRRASHLLEQAKRSVEDLVEVFRQGNDR